MKTAVGLDIGSSAVRAVEVSHGRTGSVLERMGQVLLPQGAVRDGEIVEDDVVVDALQHLWKSAGFKNHNVAVGLSNQQVVVRRLELPYMSEAEIRASLPLQIEGQVPLPVDEAVLDFCFLGEHVNEADEKRVRILAVAALKTMVDGLMAIIKRARLQPVGVDLDAFAALRSLAPPGVLGDDGGEMLVDVGGTVTDIAVHRDGVPQFVRTVMFGGHNVTAALAEELDLPTDEAEQRKLRLAAGEVDPDGDGAAEIITAQSRRLIDQLKGSIDYVTAQADIPTIERIVLTGGASRWPGLADEMAQQLQLDITTGSPVRDLETGKGVDAAELELAEPHLAVAVGLAIGAQ